MAILKNPKWDKFCREFVVNGGNVSKAVVSAGFSEKGAHVQGTRLLKKVVILERIAELRAPMEAKLDLSKEKLVARLCQFVFTDLRDFFDEHGNLISIPELSADAAGAIIGLEIESVMFDGFEISKLKKIKRNDPIKAAELIANIMGYKAPDKKEISKAKTPVVKWK